MKPAHIIVDFQNDFVDEQGALTTHSAHLGKTITDIMNLFAQQGQENIATQDWHPIDHVSFASTHNEEPRYTDESRPEHCVADTRGAQLHDSLGLTPNLLFKKGKDPLTEEYSACASGGLTPILREKGIDTVFLSGVATDYCVKSTALDAIKEGFTTYVITDAIKGVADDVVHALDAMKHEGVQFVTSSEISSLLGS